MFFLIDYFSLLILFFDHLSLFFWRNYFFFLVDSSFLSWKASLIPVKPSNCMSFFKLTKLFVTCAPVFWIWLSWTSWATPFKSGSSVQWGGIHHVYCANSCCLGESHTCVKRLSICMSPSVSLILSLVLIAWQVECRPMQSHVCLL